MLLSARVAAQEFSIVGTVKDGKSNQVLAGASVQLENSNRAEVTDAFGKFQIGKLSEGKYVLIIRFIGYQEKREEVSLASNSILTILMDESAQLTDEVVVYATRANEKTPTTFTTISGKTLQSQNFGQDMPMLLNWTPSLVTTSDAGAGVGYTGLRIRGSDATRINVTINGIPYNDSESQGTYWVDIPDVASSTQNVQIQRGVGTSTNGAGAFGASINLQTNSRNDEPYGTVTNSFGSFGTHRHSISLGTGLIDDHWVLDGRASKIGSDGFIDRASSDLQSYYFSAGYYAGKTMIKAIVFGGNERTYQSWYGVPESRLTNNIEAMEITASNEGWNEDQTNNLLNSNSRTFNIYTYENQVDDYKQDHYQLHFSHRLNTVLVANASLHYTKGRGYYEEYKYADKLSNYGLDSIVVGDSVIKKTDIIRRRWLDNNFYGVTYSLNYEKGKINAVLGGAWNNYDGDHFGEIAWAQVTTVPATYQYYFNKGKKEDFNIYLKVNYQITSRVNAFLDLQYRSVNYTTYGLENKQNAFDVKANYNFFNPKAGLTYSFSDQQNVYTSFGIGHREPVRDDFVDNLSKTPKAEELHNWEAGYRIATSRFTLNANVYLMRYKNQLVLTGALNDTGASLRTNVKRSYRVGMELEGTVKLSNKFIWRANLTLSNNKIRKFTEVLYDYGQDFDEYNIVKREYTNTSISFSPSVIAGSGFSFLPFKNADVTLLTKYVGKQFLDNTENDQRSIEAYLVNDVRLSYAWKPSFIKEIDFSFLFNNVFNSLYSSNGYTWGYAGGGAEFRENYFYPQAGRNFMAMISLKI